MARRLLPLLIVAGIIAGLALSVQARSHAAAPASVIITQSNFQTSSLAIAVGSTVTWTNADTTDHTTVSDGAYWNSGILHPGNAFSQLFSLEGTFPYHCTIHITMTAEIVVTQPTATPTATNTATPSITRTPTQTRTPTVTRTPTRTATATATRGPAHLPLIEVPASPTPTPTATNTPVPTQTPIPTETPEPTLTPLPAGVIPNGNFEQGREEWFEYGSPYDIIRMKEDLPKPLLPHSGVWAAWLGGRYDATTGIEQEVTVSRPYFSFWYWAASADACGYDTARVVIDNTAQVFTLDLCGARNTNGWKRAVVNLSAYSKQTVLLSVEVETDKTYNSNWFVDDFSFVAKP